MSVVSFPIGNVPTALDCFSVVVRKQISQNLMCCFMRYREIPASSAPVCRKGGIDYNVPRHEYLYKLCTIPQDYSKPAFLENGQPKDAAIAAQR